MLFCEQFKTLPRAGGVLDQDYFWLVALNVVAQERAKAEAVQNQRKIAAEARKSKGGRAG